MPRPLGVPTYFAEMLEGCDAPLLCGGRLLERLRSPFARAEEMEIGPANAGGAAAARVARRGAGGAGALGGGQP